MMSSRRLRSALVAAAVLAVALVVVLVTNATNTPVEDTASTPGSAADGAAAPKDTAGDTIALPPGLQPEGLTSDGGSTFYVGSLADGHVIRGDLQTGETDVLVPGRSGRVAVGIALEKRAGRLWVAGGSTGAVTVYDTDTGRQLGRWLTPGSGFLNDLTVTEDAVYVTDSQVQRLVVVPLGDDGSLPPADGATTLPLTGDISFDPANFNANGIRALDDQTLVLVQNVNGKLFRVDAHSGSTDEIEITRGRLTGGDGLELGAGRLFVVRGSGDENVDVVRLGQGDRTGQVERVVTDPDLDVPSTATFASGQLWVVNARFDTEPTPTTAYSLARVDFR